MAATTTTEAVFDRAALSERTRGDGAVMRRVLASFVAEAAETLRALRAASERGNLRFAQEFAYTLRLAAANAGAPAVAKAAAEVAQAAAGLASEAGAPATLEPPLARLEADLRRFRDGIADELGPSA